MCDERIKKRSSASAGVTAAVLLLSFALLLAAFCFGGCKSSPPASESASASSGSQAAGGQSRVAGLFKDDPEPYKVFQSVQDDYRASRFEDAVKKLETLLKESPDAPWAEVVQFQLVQALRVKGDYQQALRQVDLFLGRYPSSPDAPNALLYKGEINLRIGKDRKGTGGVNSMSKFYLDRARRVFEEVREKYPAARDLGAQAVLYLGSTYEEMEESARAAEAFRKVVDEYGDTAYPPRALFALAGVALREGDVEAAERAFGEVTDRYPASPEAKRAMSQLEALGLVGYAASPLEIREWIGQPPPEVKDLKAKATLINFWAIWCPHCKQNIPKIGRMAETYASRGLNVVGVSRERAKFEAEAIREYIRTHPMRFPTGIDDEAKTSAAYAVTSIPRVVVVDAEGKIRWHGHPDYLSDKVIEKVLEETAGS